MYAMGLPAGVCHHAGHFDILGIAEDPPKRITRQRIRQSVLPGHDHTRIQATGERHSDPLRALEETRKISRKYFAKVLIELLRCAWGLLLPFMRIEVEA